MTFYLKVFLFPKSICIFTKKIKDMKYRLGFENTYKFQLELLPRITIRYDDFKLLGFDWLFFSVYIYKED